jgi:inorganic phosphate transporter, PiT family
MYKLKLERSLVEKKIVILEADIEKEKIQRDILTKEMVLKNSELINLANFIVENEDFLTHIQVRLSELANEEDVDDIRNDLQKLVATISGSVKLHAERQELLNHSLQLHESFYARLDEQFPELSTSEKRLSALLRLNLTSKQIASLLNISSKSVDMSRYRLRKKLDIPSDRQLTDFLNSL